MYGLPIACLDTIQYVRGKIYELKLQGDERAATMESKLDKLILNYASEKTLNNHQDIMNKALAILLTNDQIHINKDEQELITSDRCNSFLCDLEKRKSEISSLRIEDIDEFSLKIENDIEDLKNATFDGKLNFYEQNQIYLKILENKYLLLKKKSKLGLQTQTNENTTNLMQYFLAGDIERTLINKDGASEELLLIIEQLEHEIYRREFKDFNIIFDLLIKAEEIKYGKVSATKFNNISKHTVNSEKNIKVNKDFIEFLKKFGGKTEEDMFGTKFNPIITLEKLKQEYPPSSEQYYQYYIVTRYKDENGKYIVMTETLREEFDVEKYKILLEERKNGIHPGISSTYVSEDLNTIDFKEIYFEEYGVGFIYMINDNNIARISYNATPLINIATFDSFETAKNNNFSPSMKSTMHKDDGELILYKDQSNKDNYYLSISVRSYDSRFKSPYLRCQGTFGVGKGDWAVSINAVLKENDKYDIEINNYGVDHNIKVSPLKDSSLESVIEGIRIIDHKNSITHQI